MNLSLIRSWIRQLVYFHLSWPNLPGFRSIPGLLAVQGLFDLSRVVAMAFCPGDFRELGQVGLVWKQVFWRELSGRKGRMGKIRIKGAAEKIPSHKEDIAFNGIE